MQFDFGQNWSDFSNNAITSERVDQAVREFSELLQDVPLQQQKFLDIGFGQGFSLLSATALGAETAGVDINPKCAEVIERNKVHFPGAKSASIPTLVGSILDKDVVGRAKELIPDAGNGYDVVHSWGVLHHTGNMKLAIEHAASLVRPGGYFVLAIYNRHWTSPIWLMIKWLYCKSPSILQEMMVTLFYPIIWTAKLIVTGENPKKQKRGMDFFYDVVDWVGGYPYEYAGKMEVMNQLEPLGFSCIKFNPSQVPTGCNEFVFQRQL